MYRRIHTAQPQYVRPSVLVYVHKEQSDEHPTEYREASGFGISLGFVAIIRILLEL